jgi:hypothetical protein
MVNDWSRFGNLYGCRGGFLEWSSTYGGCFFALFLNSNKLIRACRVKFLKKCCFFKENRCFMDVKKWFGQYSPCFGHLNLEKLEVRSNRCDVRSTFTWGSVI